jgi:hypothetical protein
MMRFIGVCSLVLLAGVAHGQAPVCNPACANQPAACCNIPAASPFMAAENVLHNSPIFRGLVPNNGGACAATTDLNVIPASVVNGPLAPVTVVLSPTVTLSFNLGEGVERWNTTGDLGGGFCFTPEFSGFHHPNVNVTVMDNCGTHVVTVGQPAFLCVTPTEKFVCFKSKNVGGQPPLPPNFDRYEDICAVFS